jgi:mono/diheme cytochrome c family protein
MLKMIMKQLPALAWLAMTLLDSTTARADDPVKRGEYLVHVISCGDCHTPGSLAGKPDMAKYLGGSSIGFQIPGLGIFYAPNLTPDPETGLGKWSEADIVTALRTGMRPDGRELAPIMPWRSFAGLTDADAHAIAAYLKTLPPVANAAPAPVGPTEKAPGPYMTVVMPN